jgi:hypothetical protein
MKHSSGSSEAAAERGFVLAPFDTLPAVGARVLRIDGHLATKAALLGAYARGLDFPAYFRHNWDALEECLRDLAWVSEPRLVIYHDGLPLAGAAHHAELRIYLQILSRLTRERAPQGPEVTPAFAPACARPLEELLRGS